MAKPRGDSKLAVAGALTLVLAIAGVLLVKEPLRSSRPVGSGLEMKQTTGEHLVRARLWEDPVAAVERAIHEKGPAKAAGGSSLAQRLASLRQAIADRARSGQRLTVLLITTSGGPYVESTETRLRDRYAVGTALGAACYVPEDENRLSFVLLGAGQPCPGPSVRMVPTQKNPLLRVSGNPRGQRLGRVVARRGAQQRLLHDVDLRVSRARVSGDHDARVSPHRV